VISPGDSVSAKRERELAPFLEEKARKQRIKEAQEQQYLQSIHSREEEAQAQLQAIEVERQKIQLEQERIDLRRKEKEVNTFDLMNALLDEMAKKLNVLVDMEKFKVPQGKTFPFNFRITDESVRFDFVEGERKSYGIPSDAFVNLPYTPLRALIILDDGGSDIVFGTNDTPISRLRGGTLKANTHVQIAFDYPVISSLTIGLAPGQSSATDVRVIGML
jgi:hypothetical protein